MKPLARMLAVAALVASALPAAAHDRDRDGDRPGAAVPAPQPYGPPGDGWRVDRRPWREGTWRQRRIAEIRAELRELEARRAELHARFGWSPARTRNFERWYAFRRAELERRYWELQRVAWR